jgi:hypothetical protein
VAKPGGLLYAAYCIDSGTLYKFGFEKGNVEEYLANGKIERGTFRCHSNPSDLFQLYKQEDIAALTADLPARRLHYVGVDMLTNWFGFHKTVDDMPQERFALYIDYHFSICERADMVGASNHSLDILQKSI